MISELLVLAALGSAVATDSGTVANRPAERGGGAPTRLALVVSPAIPLFRATGVRDAATAATVVHCTNLGGTTRSVYVEILDFDGALDCSMAIAVAPDETRTFSTRPTALYSDDASCAAAPLTEQGSLLISLNEWTRLICTVQIVDPIGATPRFAERLDLFDRNGIPLSALIFADGFESGSTSEWSSAQV